MGRKKGITRELILSRRTEVARLLSRGVSVNVIAEHLHVDVRTIFEDQRYIQQHASALRTATASEFALDKNMSAHNDILDSFRMCCKYFHIEEKPRLPYPFG